MRTLRGQNIVRNLDETKFPDGTIQNETDFVDGTPVTEEVYGDILVNLYKLLKVTKTAPNELQDEETASFQIIDSLRQLTNELNDKDQLLTKIGANWSVNIDFDLIPDKYVVFARADEAFDGTVQKTEEVRFRGAAATPIFEVTSAGFNAGDDVMIIIDSAEVRIVNLTNDKVLQELPLYTGLGSPLAFDETNVLKYELQGNLIYNDPISIDLIEKIKTLTGEPNAVIYDTVVFKSHILCMARLPILEKLKFFQFELSNPATAEELNLTLDSGAASSIEALNIPYMYCDNEYIYITNSGGALVPDGELHQYDYTPANPDLVFTAAINLDNAFVKTSNVVIKDSAVFTLINSVLKKYPFTGGESIIGDYKSIDGVIFNLNNSAYYTAGETGVKWKI